MKSAKIFMYDRYAGILTENENGFSFVYDTEYLQQTDAEPISLTMPQVASRSKLQVPTKPASFAIETIFIFQPIFPHYFPFS